MEKTVCKINFAHEIVTSNHVMGVVKESADSGVLVWLGYDPTMYGFPVVVRKSIGDEYLSLRGTTVGNIYGVNPWLSAEGKALKKRDPNINPEYADIDDEAYAPIQATYNREIGLLVRKCIHLPIVKACKGIGVTKLRKHQGNFGSEIKGLDVEVLSGKRATIFIEL